MMRLREKLILNKQLVVENISSVIVTYTILRALYILKFVKTGIHFTMIKISVFSRSGKIG